MDVTLQTYDPGCVLELRDLHLLGDGNDYQCLLVIRSDGFQLERPFWFEPFCLRTFLQSLVELDSALAGIAKLQPLHERDYIQLEGIQGGHVVVSGEIFGTTEIPQSLRFGFKTDQTCLGPLIKDIRKVVESGVAV
jgi:hypothetical protein